MWFVPPTRSLAFRLSAAYCSLFALGLGAFLYLFYWFLSANLYAGLDNLLEVEMSEIIAAYLEEGEEAVQTAVDREARHMGTSHVFFRVLDSSRNVLWSSDLDEWPSNLSTELKAGDDAPLSREVTKLTIDSSSGDFSLRLVRKPFSEGMWIEGGIQPLEQNALLARFSMIFLAIGVATLLIAAPLSSLIARRGLRQVGQVTEAAIEISKANLDTRVPVRRSGDEIDNLAVAFNQMLERIQLLVVELKQVTEDVAHELRSPLTCIRGTCELTLSRPGSSEDAQLLGADVMEEVERLLGTINDMLRISELEASVAPLELERLDVGEILRQACELFQPLADEAGSTINLSASDVPRVTGDRSMLERAFANLIDNALKYGKPGGSLTIEVSGSPSRVSISFRDDGVGIEEALLPRIFERFFRADPSRSGPGAGLGLSMVKAIVRAHQGTIDVQSETGAGSRFTISLPVSRE